MKKLFKLLLRWSLRLALFFIFSTLLVALIYRFVNPPATYLMFSRSWDQKKEGKEMVWEKEWKNLEEISPYFPLAVVASEDQLFLEHNGFDIKAIEKAIAFNEKKRGKKVKGASTISQQTAKNVFLWPGRSWIRKGFEVYFTFLIETVWSKDRIMEVYLNVIEMGPGIYGAQAAAQFYYNKDASKLNKTECAAIASVLPNPLKWDPRKPSPYLSKKKTWILKQMNWLDEKVVFEEGE